MAYRVVLVTAPDVGTAGRIARALVEEGLAACVNVVQGVSSVYRWRGEVREEGEVLMVAKTTDSAFEALSKRVRELHPYEVPEVISLEVREGLPEYLEWVSGSVISPGAGSRSSGRSR